MRRLIVTASIVQLITLVRPLTGAVLYLATRSTLASQRTAVANLIAAEENA